MRQVEEERAGSVGLVHGVIARKAEPDVVLGQQDVGDAPPDIGLVLPDPDQLRRRETGERVVAGDRDQPLPPDSLANQVAFGGGALVVPQDGGAQDLIGLVQEHRPVHLSGQADRDHLVGAHARRGEDLADGGYRRVPPQLRRLLAPERLRDLEGVFGGADCAYGSRLVDQDSLGRRGRDVDADDVRHRDPAPSARRAGGDQPWSQRRSPASTTAG